MATERTTRLNLEAPKVKTFGAKVTRRVLSDVSNKAIDCKNILKDGKSKPATKLLKNDKPTGLTINSKGAKVIGSKVASKTVKTLKPVSKPRLYHEKDKITTNEKLTVAFSALVLSVDVDSNDDGRYLMVSEYVKDIYVYLKHQEADYAIRKGHLLGQTVTPKMRSILVDWLVSVHDRYELSQETLYLCVNILDRYIQDEPMISRKELQLVGMAALLIASKYEDIYPVTVEDLIYCCNQSYTDQELITLERKMFVKLKYKLNAPLGIHFLRRYVKILGVDSLSYNLSKYLLELCFINYTLAPIPYSCLAASSLCLATRIICDDKPVEEIWNATITEYSGYCLKDLIPHIKEQVEMLSKVEKNSLQGIRRKFASTDRLQVSCLQNLHALTADKVL